MIGSATRELGRLNDASSAMGLAPGEIAATLDLKGMVTFLRISIAAVPVERREYEGNSVLSEKARAQATMV